MRYRSLVFLVLFSILVSSCSNEHKKLLKSNDHDAKYEAAVKAYNKGDYYHATQLFENLLMFYRGRDKAESVNLYYAKSLLGTGDYFSAGYQFQNFVRWFPFSEDAEEALYQAAYCKYLESPAYSLDQTLTYESIKDFQTYIEKYPNSIRVGEANKHMDELRNKIIRKEYTNSYNYYKTGNYQAAQTALKAFVHDYPDAEYRHDAMYYMILSGVKFAENSIEDKKFVRYEVVKNDYEKFVSLYPSSKKANELRKIMETAFNDIEIK